MPSPVWAVGVADNIVNTCYNVLCSIMVNDKRAVVLFCTEAKKKATLEVPNFVEWGGEHISKGADIQFVSCTNDVSFAYSQLRPPTFQTCRY